jgi:hypothetical protein
MSTLLSSIRRHPGHSSLILCLAAVTALSGCDPLFSLPGGGGGTTTVKERGEGGSTGGGGYGY